VNVDALRRELEFVTAEPERWDQSTWVHYVDRSDAEPGADWTCGTTACLAGWTALHAGYRPHPPYESVVVGPRGTPEDVEDLARRLLGLTPGQANLLFDGSNTLRDLWELARALTDGAIEVPPAVAVLKLENYDPAHDDEHYRRLVADFDHEDD
jgi:hypothetical protein